MPVRVYDISKKLGLDNREIISKAKSLGIVAARVASSSLDKITAEYLEGELLKDHPEIAAPPLPKVLPPPVSAPVVAKPIPPAPSSLSQTSSATRPAPLIVKGSVLGFDYSASRPRRLRSISPPAVG
ncbi:MAG: translation initiation factor IF-2 N-terminal domain-containing protein [Verrucomicrobia bacterium]|jgi:hypothetical protein|nr:translation initiation factor IF-2 N-terminal domain-containing protein [Verrucomicrobiota bacterium]